MRYSWDSSTYVWSSGECPGRGSVMPEWLLHHDPTCLGQTSLGQTLDHGAEEEGGSPGRRPGTFGALFASATLR